MGVGKTDIVQKLKKSRRNFYPPKAEVTGSNPVGCAIIFNELGVSSAIVEFPWQPISNRGEL